MKVIWYNTADKTYQTGSEADFHALTSIFPERIVDVESFQDSSDKTLRKIVMELNKCQLSMLR